jgi:hypothetical protein
VPEMGQYDLALQDLHLRRAELLQLIDVLESGRQIPDNERSRTLLMEWKQEVAQIDREISEVEELNTGDRPPPPPADKSGH